MVLATLILLNILASIVYLQTRIVLVDHALCLSELSGLVCFAHFIF